LFNDTVGSSGFKTLNDKLIVNSELEATWKETAVAWFKFLSLHLPGVN
jgi:hypothetical protein